VSAGKASPAPAAAKNAPAAKAPEARRPGAKPPAPHAYDPLAPRLRPVAAPDPRAKEKEARKARARLADLERLIGEREQRVKDVEGQMASPGFYDDRARAEEAVTARQQILDEVNALMSEWESLQAAVEVKG
jgi:hypothetical protein